MSRRVVRPSHTKRGLRPWCKQGTILTALQLERRNNRRPYSISTGHQPIPHRLQRGEQREELELAPEKAGSLQCPAQGRKRDSCNVRRPRNKSSRHPQSIIGNRPGEHRTILRLGG